MKTNYNNTDEQIIQMLTPQVEVKPSPDMREKILREATFAPRRPAAKRIGYWLGAVASVAAVVVIALTTMFNTPVYAARKYFSKALIATQDAKSMVMELSVRTIADEPIDYINPANDFVPATVKVIYDEPMMWSISKKSGRTVLYKGADEAGDNIYQWIGGQDGRTGWLQPHRGYVEGDLAVMLDPRLLLEAEYRTAERNKGAEYEILDLGEVAVVKVKTIAQGDYSKSDYMLNTSLAEANTIREYTFAKDSGELCKVRIAVVVDKEPVTVVESESITFDEPLIADDLYNKEAFGKVSFVSLEPEPVNSSQLVGISADKAAKIILDAMADWNTDVLDTAMYYFGDVKAQVERIYKGLKVQSVGKPFKSGLYPGRFVECKVVLANGEKQELVLALRNDNKQKVWLLDGGL